MPESLVSLNILIAPAASAGVSVRMLSTVLAMNEVLSPIKFSEYICINKSLVGHLAILYQFLALARPSTSLCNQKKVIRPEPTRREHTFSAQKQRRYS